MAWNTNTPRQYKGYGTRFEGCVVKIKAGENDAVEASNVADKSAIGVIKEPNMRDGEAVSVACTPGDRVMFVAKSAIAAGDKLKVSTVTAGYVEKTTLETDAIGIATRPAINEGDTFEGTLL